MAKLLQTLIPVVLLLATTAQSQRTSFHYDFRFRHLDDLTLQGTAGFLIGGKSLLLTRATSNTVGRVLYSNPIQFWQADGQVNFETTFTFFINPLEGKIPADGLVFFIAPVGSQPPNGAAGGGFGVFDVNGNGGEIFAVEFDTFVNGWDPDYPHIGIDLGSWISKNTTDVGDTLVGQAVTAQIRYFGADGIITVHVVTGKQQKFELSYEVDLSGFLPEQVQVGLSASTGEEVAFHEVYSWSFASEIVYNEATAKSRKPFIRQFV